MSSACHIVWKAEPPHPTPPSQTKPNPHTPPPINRQHIATPNIVRQSAKSEHFGNSCLAFIRSRHSLGSILLCACHDPSQFGQNIVFIGLFDNRRIHQNHSYRKPDPTIQPLYILNSLSFHLVWCASCQHGGKYFDCSVNNCLHQCISLLLYKGRLEAGFEIIAQGPTAYDWWGE